MARTEPLGDTPVRPPRRRRRWTSFVAPDVIRGRRARGLHEEANSNHRVRVEHDAYTLLIHLSNEDGGGWTTIAVDRPTRRWAVAQGPTESGTARDSYDALYEP